LLLLVVVGCLFLCYWFVGLGLDGWLTVLFVVSGLVDLQVGALAVRLVDGLVGWCVGGLVGWWVGAWWVGGLVGWWVGGLVVLWVGGLVGVRIC